MAWVWSTACEGCSLLHVAAGTKRAAGTGTCAAINGPAGVSEKWAIFWSYSQEEIDSVEAKETQGARFLHTHTHKEKRRSWTGRGVVQSGSKWFKVSIPAPN